MKNLITAIALILVLCLGVYAVVYMQQEIPITYDGRDTDVYALQQDPHDYDLSDPTGWRTSSSRRTWKKPRL